MKLGAAVKEDHVFPLLVDGLADDDRAKSL
jgi:hypothetical protein